MPSNNQVSETLTQGDIPNGQGGFARDYTFSSRAEDRVEIDLSSDDFDTLVTVLNPDGTFLAENDDGPGGGTNSLLFARLDKAGTYTIRVQAFGGAGGGPFTLKVTRLRPVQ
ncbi:PPC domain-containing protein [Leptolyngbya sp. FACHB-261]|nr:PPC domain-containing protein [Leptolyngbya sp. FACHB-261]